MMLAHSGAVPVSPDNGNYALQVYISIGQAF